MSFQQDLWLAIESFTGHKNVITLNVVYVDFVDDLETGLFLSQLIYWSDKGGRKDGFIFKTDKEWHEELRLSRYSVRKARKKLEGMGILETKVKKANGNPTVHYKLDKTAFTEQFMAFLRNRTNENTITNNGNDGNEHSLTESTTEIKTKTTTIPEKPKRYAIHTNDGVVGKALSYYNDKYKERNGKSHPTVTQRQLSMIEAGLGSLMGNYVIESGHSIYEVIDWHFDTIPSTNDGKVFSFIGRGTDETPVIRYIEELDWSID